jgi:hypothetical protein
MSHPSETTTAVPHTSQATYGTTTMAHPSDSEATSSKHPPTEAVTLQVPDSPIQHFDTPTGLVLKVDFAWSKFKNTISETSSNGQLTPLYIQHFRPTKPQLRFDSVADGNKQIATGVIRNISIAGECTLHGRTITLKPLKRLKTQYNYLSTALSPDRTTPAPVSWIANSTLKTWDFVCLDANQMPIAKFAINWWALTQVGTFYFDKSAGEVSKEARDEVVVTGLTLMYVMCARMNNPLNLLGSMFAKPGKAEHGEGVEMEGRKMK